ncbi:hypothetical protein [Nioella nitratireducens]|uniref:hypothetical protein n=1 Tax=Nioella nitratireducens TaxID=1287720 RepID=UPI0008FD45F0|nr:hypothetical protein [Nioella nitratireducens]
MIITKATITALAIAMLSFDPALAQEMDHSAHMENTGSGTIPGEPGQDAFAAIAEIVNILRADPSTDWDQANLDALRAHLVDMNALVLGAEVETEPRPDGLAMRVSLTGSAGDAAMRMVPAHGPVLADESGWTSNVEFGAEALLWTVADPAGRSTNQIQALGFFGLMATGDHHRAHHIAIARGETTH